MAEETEEETEASGAASSAPEQQEQEEGSEAGVEPARGRKTRRGLLQAAVLVSMLAYEVKDIATFSRRLGTVRPSVSRVLHVLQRRGLVARSRRAWALTKEGRREAVRAGERLLSQVHHAQAHPDHMRRLEKHLAWLTAP